MTARWQRTIFWRKSVRIRATEVARRQAADIRLDEIKQRARDAEKPRGFGRALMDASAAGGLG